MKTAGRRIRELFLVPEGRETVRAFLFFGLALVALMLLGSQLAFRDLSLLLRKERLNLVRDEAFRIADAVAALGRDQGAIDFSRLRQSKGALESMIRERIARRPYVRQVEVRDRFGARLVRVSRANLPAGRLDMGEVGERPAAESRSEDPVVRAQLLRGPISESEVRVAIDESAIESELRTLRRSLRVKLAIAAGVGGLIFLAGFLYVLGVLRKNRLLEQGRQSAERAAYKGLLASGLAHEIRNPLNAMNLNLQMLEEELQGLKGSESADYSDLLCSIKSEIKRLESLVNNFLAYARPPDLRFEAKDLNEVLSEISRFLQPDFRQNSVELALDLVPLLPTVEIDVTQFKQALMNLLVNARQVLRAGGTVVLRSRVGPNGEAIVEVEDDGPGIPAAVREKIFEVFYSSRGGGTGLGLPIAKQIVEKHGGTLEIHSIQGQGTMFRIRLPRTHARLAAADPDAQTIV